jgi:DNA-binding beta-propeller fold protein YncE
MRRCFRLFLVGVALLFASLVFGQLPVPEIPFDFNASLLKWPEHIYMGEPIGVAVNSKGHVFVYTRTGSVNASTATSRTFVRGGARLFEFDQNGAFVREIGQDLYGFVFAERVRIDSEDNIWAVDGGSNMLIKFSPDGRVAMTFGRKPEAISVPEPPRGLVAPPPAPGAPPPPVPFQGRGPGAGVLGDNFNHPSDVAFDTAGNIFVADGHGGNTNARIAKFDKDGRFVKTWGSRGKEPGQFDTPHAIAVDAKGNVYVADRGNSRIQIFDNDGNFKTQWLNVGTPFTMCVTQGPHQYLYTSNSNFPGNFEAGQIYKMELDGTILGKFGKAGTGPKDFGTVHTIDCLNENEVYMGLVMNWRVAKITLHPTAQRSSR